MKKHTYCKHCGKPLPGKRAKSCEACKAASIQISALEWRERRRLDNNIAKRGNKYNPRLTPELERSLASSELNRFVNAFCDVGQTSKCVSLKGTPQFNAIATVYLCRDLGKAVGHVY